MRMGTAAAYIQGASFALLTIALFQLSLDTAPAMATLLQGRIEHRPRAASVETTELLKDSFPSTYEGSWHCVSTVTESAVADVPPATVSQCDVQFKRESDGRIRAVWLQQGWTEAQSSIVSFSETEAQMDRTAYFWADGTGGAWAAKSRDSFTLTSDNSITSTSTIDQYLDGLYLGRYQTRSVLKKIDGPATTAMLPRT